MKRLFSNQKVVLWIALIGTLVVIALFIPLSRMVNNLRIEEQRKVELWARAISRKSEMIKRSEDFYGKIAESERIRLTQFVEAYKVIISQPNSVNLSSGNLKFYMRIVLDNKTIPVIITDEFNNIQFHQNVNIGDDVKVLSGDLYKQFSRNEPYKYEVYGMNFKLYYTESKVFSYLRKVLDEINFTLLSEITDNSIEVPVIITDSTRTHLLAYGNIPKRNMTGKKKMETIRRMIDSEQMVKINLPENHIGYVFYEKSRTITLLKYYPALFIFIIALFGGLLFVLYRSIKKGEENSLFVGMCKETAHQLGTPISSLMAWIELLRVNEENAVACKEMDKDIRRLNMVAQRFSQIGSVPKMEKSDIIALIDSCMAYMAIRSPKKVKFNINIPHDSEIILPINVPLMEWVFENLTKNAVDAMEGNGIITISMERMENHIHINFSDTGKGMTNKEKNRVFLAGYSTKRRGWGLGLALCQRIVEEYHHGKIYVLKSEVGIGTTFRIELYNEI